MSIMIWVIRMLHVKMDNDMYGCNVHGGLCYCMWYDEIVYSVYVIWVIEKKGYFIKPLAYGWDFNQGIWCM